MIAYDDFLLNLQKERGKKHELPSKLKFRRNLTVLSLTQSTNFVNLSFLGVGDTWQNCVSFFVLL